MSNNIAYLLFRRSAAQFTEDLNGISEELHSLDEQERLGVYSYSGDIKKRIESIREKLISIKRRIEKEGC